MKKGIFILASLSLMLIACNPKEKLKTEILEGVQQATLQEQLDAKKQNFELKADDAKKKDYKEGIDAVRSSGILSTAKKVGDKAPDFVLTNASGKEIQLSTLLSEGAVVLTWYRGGWCPYCNLTLAALQDELPEFQKQGASLVALTPELPDKSLNTKEKNELQFEVLSDVGNKVAHTYGIVFELTDAVAKRYNDGFQLNAYNGDQSNTLPLAATYIIAKDGTITYAFLDADYRNRAEPAEITAELKKLK